MKTIHSVVLVALLALTTIGLSSDAQAQYRKKVVIVSGQEAPGTASAQFSPWMVPQCLGIAESGKTVFRGFLETDVGDATYLNDEGVWVAEADTVRMLARKGGPVPGMTGMYFLNDRFPEVFMDPLGHIGIEAEYSATGDNSGDVMRAFFIEENDVLVEKFCHLDVLPWGDTLFLPLIRAFNNGRALFDCVLKGPSVSGSSDAALCMYSPDGIEVFLQVGKPAPTIGGGFYIRNWQSGGPLTHFGKTVIQCVARIVSGDEIGAVMSWDPISGFVPMRLSAIDSAYTVFGAWRMNWDGGNVNRSWETYQTHRGLFDNYDNLIVKDSSDDISYPISFVCFDDERVGLLAQQPDGNTGIWIGDKDSLTRVAQKGDLVPGLPGEMRFWRVNHMCPNGRGQVAFSDLAVDTATGAETAGVWLADANAAMQNIALRGEKIRTAPSTLRTVQDAYINTEISGTGADGTSTTLNNRGGIAFGVTFSGGGNAFVIATPGLVVNSIGDAPDLDPGDGICNTGVTDNPDDWGCTLRAAIMEANAYPGYDTILFDIGVEPEIYPQDQLPHITEEVLIDAASQPGIDMVVLNGFECDDAPDAWPPCGLVIEEGGSTIRGLKIGYFLGDGIYIIGPGGQNRIEGCEIGFHDSGEYFRNKANGIHIHNSSSNVVGGFEHVITSTDEYFEENGIQYNEGAGVFVHEDSHGISFYNTIRGNAIRGNHGLGIDISPEGVTENDTLGGVALDAVTNFPLVDSVLVTEGGPTEVFGSIYERVGRDFVIDLYLNMDCDSTLYGEGFVWEDSTVVQTNGEGKGEFLITLPFEADFTAEFISMTATLDGYTSEFSRCWPSVRKIKLLDVEEQPIANDLFSLAIVRYDPPTFTKEHITTFNSDDDGIINLTEYFLDNTLRVGDTIEIKMELSPSGSQGQWPVKSPEVTLDNAYFDSATFDMGHDTLTNDTLQEVSLDHGTFKFDVRVSLEWDATREYIDSLQSAFRKAANYLYDVGDGQWTLGSVTITEDMGLMLTGSDDDDIIIVADNYAGAEYFRDDDPRGFISRRFYHARHGRTTLSAAENPMNPAADEHWRQLAQLLGHHLLGLRNEETSFGSACNTGALGLMQWPWDGVQGPMDSEMSSLTCYNNVACQATEQFRELGMSCWETFVSGFAGEYRGVLVPVYMPEDSYLAPGFSFYAGPNDHGSDGSVNLQYDVGAQVEFPGLNDSSSAFDELWTFTNSTGEPLAGVEVHTYRGDRAYNKTMEQGYTSPDGQLWLVGVDDGHVVNAGNVYISVVTGSGDPYTVRRYEHGKILLGNPRAMGTTSASAATLVLQPISGDFPLVCWASLAPGGMNLQIKAENPFGAVPEFSYEADDGSETSGTFDLTGLAFNTYMAPVTVDSRSQGSVTVSAEDDSSTVFDFGIDYKITNAADSQEVVKVTSADGAAQFSLDSSAVDILRAIVTSSHFPIIRTGLSGLALQAGKTYSLAIDQPVLAGVNSLSISYDETEFSSIDGGFNSAQSLQVFSWNTTTEVWDLIGGEVDTLLGVVSVPITEAGIYAAFTTDFVTDVGDETDATDNLPYHFELSQNYPNPFNPVTTIVYSLPRRSHVTVEVFNVLGQRVRSLVDREESAGAYTISWNGDDASGESVATGVYLYRFQAGDHIETKKMLLLK